VWQWEKGEKREEREKMQKGNRSWKTQREGECTCSGAGWKGGELVSDVSVRVTREEEEQIVQERAVRRAEEEADKAAKEEADLVATSEDERDAEGEGVLGMHD
jgi:hypothetical protein